MEIAAEAYKGKPFNEVATVSDLYFCAMPSRQLRANSPCGNLHLPDLIAEVRPKAIITKGNRTMHYFKKYVGRTCHYMTAYPIQIDGVSTTLLPVRWWDLNNNAYGPAKTWLLENIRAIDPDAGTTV